MLMSGVVIGLLADPRYGQRVARHWMEIFGAISDWAGWTDGKQVRDSQPHIWRWRIGLSNRSMRTRGMTRWCWSCWLRTSFIPADPAALRGDGVLGGGIIRCCRGSSGLRDTVNPTSRAFLGLTMHCAKCHDHKFDPVTQEEYYKLRAVFEPHDVRIDPVRGRRIRSSDGFVRAYDKELGAERRRCFTYSAWGDSGRPDTARGGHHAGGSGGGAGGG